MKLILIFIVSCLVAPLSFSQSQGFLSNLYKEYLKSAIYIEKGEYSSALEELKKVRAKEPRSSHVLIKMALVLIRLDKMEEVEEVLKEAKENDPGNLNVSLLLMFAYSHDKKNEEFEKEYGEFLEKAHVAKPEDIGISEYLAQFYFYRDKLPEAIELYETILLAKPEHIKAIFWLGFLYEEAGKSEDAIKLWKKGLEADSSYAPILNALGYVYAEKGVNLEEAEEMIKK